MQTIRVWQTLVNSNSAMNQQTTDPVLDQESESLLTLMAEERHIQSRRIPGVRTVLVVLSAKGMVFDKDSLRQKVLIAYPDAAVFFRTPSSKPLGAEAPQHVDLLIDLTGPGQREKWFNAKRLRRIARVAIGRRAGFLRARIYDRVYDERKKTADLSLDFLERERCIQREVLALAGITIAQRGDVLPDVGRVVALEHLTGV